MVYCADSENGKVDWRSREDAISKSSIGNLVPIVREFPDDNKMKTMGNKFGGVLR
jgi:hypothetical protein